MQRSCSESKSLCCSCMSLQLWQDWKSLNAWIIYTRSMIIISRTHPSSPILFFFWGRVAITQATKPNIQWCVINFLQSYRNVTKLNPESLQWVKKYFVKWIHHSTDSCVHLEHTCTHITYIYMYNPELINSLWLCWTTAQFIVLEIIVHFSSVSFQISISDGHTCTTNVAGYMYTEFSHYQ